MSSQFRYSLSKKALPYSVSSANTPLPLQLDLCRYSPKQIGGHACLVSSASKISPPAKINKSSLTRLIELVLFYFGINI